jgi:chromosome segregation ATPase
MPEDNPQKKLDEIVKTIAGAPLEEKSLFEAIRPQAEETAPPYSGAVERPAAPEAPAPKPPAPPPAPAAESKAGTATGTPEERLKALDARLTRQIADLQASLSTELREIVAGFDENPRLTALAADVEEIKRSEAKIGTWRKDLETKLKGMRDWSDRTDVAVKAEQETEARTEETVSDLSEKVKALEAFLEAKLRDVREWRDGTDAAVRAQQESGVRSEQSLAALATKIEGIAARLEARLKDMEARVEQRLSELRASLEQALSELADFSDQFSGWKQKVEAEIKAREEGRASAKESLSLLVIKLEGLQGELGRKLLSVEARTQAISSWLEAVERRAVMAEETALQIRSHEEALHRELAEFHELPAKMEQAEQGRAAAAKDLERKFSTLEEAVRDARRETDSPK